MEQIDILLATYNGEKYLREQLDSILNQTYQNFKLIVSDDCSTDLTREILKEYEEKDKRIIVFYQEKNLCYIKNFEFLLKNVKSEYYALSDQDDVWKPEKIEVAMNMLKENNADLYYCDLNLVDKDCNMLYESYWKFRNKDILYPCFVFLFGGINAKKIFIGHRCRCRCTCCRCLNL